MRKLAVVLVVLVAVVIAIGYGAIHSTRLPVWAAAQANRHWEALTIEGVSGRLAGPLNVERLTVETPAVRVTVQNAQLKWTLRRLLGRTLDIEALSAKSVQVELREHNGAEPASGEPFELPDIDVPLTIDLGRLAVGQLHITPAGGERVSLFDLATSIHADGAEWTVRELALRHEMAEIKASGNITTRATYPLSVQLATMLSLPDIPPWPVTLTANGDLDTLVLTADGQSPYPVTLTGRIDDVPKLGLWTLEANVQSLDLSQVRPDLPALTTGGTLQARGEGLAADIRADAFAKGLAGLDAVIHLSAHWEDATLRVDELTASGNIGTLQGRGHARLGTLDDTQIEAALDWQALRWPALDHWNSPSGQTRISGSPSAYQVQIEGQFEGPPQQMPSTHLSLAAHGNLESLAIDRLQVDTLDGQITATGALNWSDGLDWTARAEGRELNPGVMDAAWPGRLGFALTTEGRYQQRLSTHVHVEKLSGRLRNQAVDGQAELDWSDETLRIDALALRIADARLNVSGRWNAGWDLAGSMDAPDLSRVLPQAGGALAARFTLQGKPEAPEITVNADATDLAWDALRIQSLALTADLSPQANQPLTVDLKLEQASLGDQSVQSGRVLVDGTAAGHQIRATAQSAQGQLDLMAEGAWRPAEQQWAGTLNQLALVSKPDTAWVMTEPTALSAGPKRVSLSSLCLRHEGESLCVEGRWQGAAGWHALAEVTSLQLDRAQAYMGDDHRLEGVISARLEAKAGSDGAVFAQAETTSDQLRVLTRPSADEGQGWRELLSVRAIRLDGHWDEAGIRLETRARVDQTGSWQGRCVIPGVRQPAQFATAEMRDCQLSADLPDVDFVALFVPALADAKGSLKAELSARGPVSEPIFNGRVELVDGAAEIPDLGLRLQAITLTLTTVPGDRLAWVGQVNSGDGHLDTEGSLALQAGELSLEGKLTGRNFAVIRTAEAAVDVTPDLRFAYSPAELSVSGQVLIPTADITPRDLSSTVQASPDVVIVDPAKTTAEPKPRPLSLDVTVALGDAVSFEGFGLRAKLGGELRFRDGPNEQPLATGQLRVIEGRYNAYGQPLEIETGRIIYTDAPVDNPGLDLRAVRRLEEVQVGVDVRGTLAQPQLTLFSSPPMSDSDILSYLLFGRPMAQSSSQDSRRVAGILAATRLSGGQIPGERLAERLGIEEVSLESQGGVEETELVLGRQISPRLFVSYGVGLFGNQSTFRTLYRLSRRWTLKTESGVDRSADIIFTIER
ncbi:MAG: translocation/assembly module TamB domain-containing protein [Pseudomonadota bacterium]|nr:translocation/assembly module TamB domain-containing protein [Pseudomonadota bacterium]